MHFPANAGLIFLTDKLTNDRYLVNTGVTLSIVPCSQNSSLSGPLLKGADGQPIPSWEFIKKTVHIQGKFFTSSFLQAAVAGPVLPGIEPGYIVFPSHKNNVYMFSKAYCYLCGKRKFLAVRRVGLMTHREYRVDRPFPVT
jgi:hypothetical protein